MNYLIDMQAMKVLYKHRSRTVVQNLDYLECASIPTLLFELSEDDKFQFLTGLEISLLLSNIIGDDAAKGAATQEQKIKTLRFALSKLPQTETEVMPLLAQVAQVKADDKGDYKYVQGGRKPLQIDIFSGQTQREYLTLENQLAVVDSVFKLVNNSIDKANFEEIEMANPNTPVNQEELDRKKQEAEAAKAAEKEQKVRLVLEKAQAKEREKAEKKAQKDAEKAEKEQAKAAAKVKPVKVEQNGVKRPHAHTLCGQAWAIFDSQSAAKGGPVPIADAMIEAKEKGLNEANVRTEYARWKKFNGITGKIASN